MGPVAWRVYFVLRSLFEGEEGQDLVEYAIILVVFALGATAGPNSVAEQVNGIFTRLASLILRSYTA